MDTNEKRIDEARAAGFDAGKNGPNAINCHYAHFATPERTKAWEEGKASAEGNRE
jgi:hypothetical protein